MSEHACTLFSISQNLRNYYPSKIINNGTKELFSNTYSIKVVTMYSIY